MTPLSAQFHIQMFMMICWVTFPSKRVSVPLLMYLFGPFTGLYEWSLDIYFQIHVLYQVPVGFK